MILLYLGTEDIHVLGVVLKGRPPLDSALEMHCDAAPLGGAAGSCSREPTVKALLLPREVDLFDNF